MFDNPNEELKRLEEQLLQAEETDRKFDRFFGDVYDEYSPAEESVYEEETYEEDTCGEEAYDEVPQEMEDLLVETPVDSGVRNYANGYGRQGQMRRNPGSAQQRPVQQRSVQPRTAPQNFTDESRYAAPVKKAKGVKGLVITACIECAGIVGVVLWWMLRIL